MAVCQENKGSLHNFYVEVRTNHLPFMRVYLYTMAMPHLTPKFIRAFFCFAPILIALAATAIYIGTGQELADFYEAYRIEHPNLTLAVTVLTHICNPIMYIVYAYIFWKARKSLDEDVRRSESRKVYAYIIMQILISFALTRMLKIAFGMPRPDIGGPMTPFTLDHGHHSFPSGHTTEIVGATLPLAWWAKKFWPSLGIGLYIGLVAYSRIYLGMHHIMDVLAGLLLGSLAAWAIHRLANRKKLMREQDKNATKESGEDKVTDIDSQDIQDAMPNTAQASVPSQTDTNEDAPRAKASRFAINPSQVSDIPELYTDNAAPKAETSETVIQAETADKVDDAVQTEPAPFAAQWTSDDMNDWAKEQVAADIHADGKVDAKGNLESWADGARNKSYHSNIDMDAFAFTQRQDDTFAPSMGQGGLGAEGQDEGRTAIAGETGAETFVQLEKSGLAENVSHAEGHAKSSSFKNLKEFKGFKAFKRSYGSKSVSNSADIPLEPSIATKAFDFCAQWPLFILSCLLILQVVAGIVDPRALWFSDEIRHAAVYENVINAGIDSADWLILQLNGLPYPDKPAVYFWFLAVLDTLPFVDMPMLFMFGTGLSALFFMWATYALARATGHDRKISFAAGLVLLTTFYFMGLTHYGRMDLLFAAAITASHVCMYHAWRQDKALMWRILGFVLAAVATLIKGPIGLALPIISSIAFIIWQGKWKRLNTRDGAFAFGIMLVILLSWVMVIWLYHGNDYLLTIFNKQIVERAVDTWHHKQAWWHYFATLPAAWLPWTLILFVLPWLTWLRNPLSPILASRYGENLGAAYLWICCITGFAFLSALSGKIVIYLLPLFPMMAILTARGIMSLSRLGSNILYFLFGLLFMLLGWLFVAIAVAPFAVPLIEIWAEIDIMSHIPLEVLVYIDAMEGAGILATICFISGIALFAWVDRRQARGALLVMTIFMTALIQPLSTYSASSLDDIMSPKEQAEVMATYIEDGYTPIAYRIFPGTYTYYTGANILDIQDKNWESLDAAVASHDKVVLAMRLSDWEKWFNSPEGMHEVHCQWIVNRAFVVVALDKTPDTTVDIDIEEIKDLIEESQADEAQADEAQADEYQADESQTDMPEQEASETEDEQAL